MPREQVSGRSGGAAALPADVPAIGAPQALLSTNRPHDQQSLRLVPIDNLRALLVAWVIAGHALLGYTAIGGWPYDEVTETTMPSSLELILGTILGPTALFVIGTFFFLSGLLAPRTIARHGAAGFVRQRILRLGVPWLIFTLLIWPFLMWVAYRSAGSSMSFWQVFETRQPFLDSGPLWFIQILLYVSVGHALLTSIGHLKGLAGPGVSTLVMTGLAIAATSFAVRLWFPARSQQVLDLHLWQWPQCIGLYALGALAASHGWAERVPVRTARRCGITVLVAVTTGIAVAALVGVSDFSRDGAPFLGGWHWQALALDVVEATLVVGGSVWLLGFAQRWMAFRTGRVTRLARSAYVAYLLQAPVLIGLEVAGRAFLWPALVKALVVATVAVVGSFGIAWLITQRTFASRIE